MIFEGKAIETYQDQRQALSLQLEGSGEVYIQLQSWDTDRKHPELTPMIGRRIRVTIEVI